MLTDGELAGIVADNHRVTQKLMRLDAAPERPLGGDLCWVGSDGERRDAEPRKMRLPSGRVGKPLVRVLGETGNDGSMARMEQQMLDAAAAMSPDAVMKMWFGSMPQNPEQMREMFTRFFAQPFGPGPSGRS